MIKDERLALFTMLARTASQRISKEPSVAPSLSIPISDSFDLATAFPKETKEADRVSHVFQLFYIFENHLRKLIIEVLEDAAKQNWWDEVPKDVRDYVAEAEKQEETKAWMAIGTRNRLSLTTYQQLIGIIEYCWKKHFSEIIPDKFLIQEARHIAHIRNAACHMTDIPQEEIDRVYQVLRDWFRVVPA